MSMQELMVWMARFAASCEKQHDARVAAAAATGAVLYYRIAQKEIMKEMLKGTFDDNPEGKAIMLEALGLVVVDDEDKIMH